MTMPGPVTPNAGAAPINPMIRQLLEQKLQGLPGDDPRRALALQVLAAADLPAPPAHVAPQVQAQNQQLLLDSIARAKAEGDARSAAAIQEAQRVAASQTELTALVHQLLAVVAEHTAVLERLRHELPDLVASEVERYFETSETEAPQAPATAATSSNGAANGV